MPLGGNLYQPSTFHGGNKGGKKGPGAHGSLHKPGGKPGGGGGGNGGGNGGNNHGGNNHHGGKGHGGKGPKSLNGMSLQDLFSIGMNLAHPMQQTKHDISTIYGPQVRGLKHDYSNYSNQMGALYTVLGNQLGDIGAGADNNYQRVNSDYTKGTQDILGSLGQTTAPDQQAFLNVLGNQALAGSKDLAQQATNEQRYNASMGDQASLENTILQRNASGDLNAALESLRKQRASDFKSTLDQNRQTAFERMLALKQYQLQAAQVAQQGKGDKWTRQFFADQFGNALGSSGNGGHHHGGHGQGGGGGNTGSGNHHQQKKLTARDIFNSVTGGDNPTAIGDLGQHQRKFLRSHAEDLKHPILAAYASTMGTQVPHVPYTQHNLMSMLREISQHLNPYG